MRDRILSALKEAPATARELALEIYGTVTSRDRKRTQAWLWDLRDEGLVEWTGRMFKDPETGRESKLWMVAEVG